MSELKDKVVVITGAGKGIGRAVAKAFAKEGASLALISRTLADLKSLEKELPKNTPLLTTAGDVAHEPTVFRFVRDVIKKFLRIDCLINNAGILTAKARIYEVETNDWDETLRVNLRGPFLMMKHVLPHMIAQRSGSVINVSSGAGKRDAPEWGPYAVSKFGVEGLTKVAAAEVKSFGVRVNAVNPGGTRTRMRAAAYPQENPLSLPTPEEVATFFLQLASDKSKAVTGQSLDYQFSHP